MKPICALLVVALGFASRLTAADIDFNRDVRPILSDACFTCHGFDAKARKAKLRLDVPEGAFAERRGVVPITPGNLKDSEVWFRITSTDPDVVMPPPDSKKTLTAAQKETIRKWIEQGAKYQRHWSFEPIVRPSVPDSRNPQSAIRNPIDAFLLARLRKEGLTPRPEADRETLIRRVSFALTGLPPTIKEVDRYLADKSPDAYEKMVDRYLASPRFGEEMARHWLDVARYADTHGLHLDNERLMWPYRDWVVRAFNNNLPFDQFTVWQLAGDLLPNPTKDQLTATGFNRCNVSTGEGGSIEAEWEYRNAVDRTATTAQAWLGLTAGCAVCHDHKYDPISAKEFYSLYAFFYSSADPPLDGNVSDHGPFVKLPTGPQKAALEEATKAETDARERLEAVAAEAEYTDPAGKKLGKRLVTDVLFDDAFPFRATSRNTTRNAADWVADPEFGAKSGRRVLRQANSYFHEDTVTFKLRPVVVPENGVLVAWVRLDPLHPPGAVAIEVGKDKVWWGTEPSESPYGGGNVTGKRQGPLPAPGQWAALTVPAIDLGLKAGKPVASISVQEFGGIAYWDAVTLTGEADPTADQLASFEAWWKGLGEKPPAKKPKRAKRTLAGPLAELPRELQDVAADGPDGEHPPEVVAKLRAFYLAFVARPVGDELAARQTEWEKARADREAADEAIPGTMIFRDAKTPRDAFVMTRGQYDKPGEKVRPGVPAVLPPMRMPEGERIKSEVQIAAASVASSLVTRHSSLVTQRRPTRLDLANWLVAPENPLTARVAANRLWQQFFGVGLVKTGHDFGTQGESPSHPELLDWLADEYRASGWDTKKFVKLLVMSDAFRRDPASTPEERAKDPENRLLAHGPRFRLDAEQVRDNALFAGGLIDLTIGGRGVMTYQPPNIWEPVGYGDSNTRYYLQDHGADLYRRSLYVFIKRTAPHPFLTNFDGPNREQSCSRRDRTNTPLQALQLMNDVQHFEAARALAERTIADGGQTTEERITFLYRTVLSRRPDADEVRLVSAALAKQRELYQADPDAAKKVVQVGESKPKSVASDVETAAWTMVANLVLNLDETLNRN